MIKYEKDQVLYYDKNGTEITDGCHIKFPDGKVQKVYLTESGELGTDATNPAWIKMGRACECEFGIYALTYEDTMEVEVVEG